ncbi:transcription termination factor 4, mitochondrial-like [Pecten maximus]|uniref:transcription termination factor 4, mitochondrial-like n=1 Tax=Pecten maximus TaxID=6579 RepID=UPI001458F78D|nr:transcription termination factor 4, mitochondrial-like [Pecten maximus]
MNILRSLRPLSSWKYGPSRLWSCVGQGETIHRKFPGDCRNLSIYRKDLVLNILRPCYIFRVVSGCGRSYNQLSSCVRFVHTKHGGTETWTDDLDDGDRTANDKHLALMEKIEGQIIEIIDSVLERTEENEMVGSNLENVLEEGVRHLYSLRLSPEQIHRLMLEYREISRHQFFIPITQFLYKNGLNGKRTCKLVTKYPDILDIPKDEIREKIEHLRELGFITPGILLLIEGLPEVLKIPVKNIKRRISDLELLFKSKDVLDLITKSPSLLIDDPALIQKKFDYVFHEMGISQRQIMYSSLFKHSLSHIRQRHVFLVRAGFFKKTVKRGQINPNPLLEDIVDISTRAFLKKYGNMTMSDYIAFRELFERESNEIQDEVEDDSDDEEIQGWKR